jgi:TRAP-type C4-dicarboxylate transport system permease small subunit
MSSTRNPFQRLLDGLILVSGYFSGVAILAATLIICEQVVVRYVFNAATIWQVEIAVYLLIAATFLGAPYGLKQNAHINIDLLIIHFSDRFQRNLHIVTSFLALLFCIFLAWRGCVMWWEAYTGDWKSSTILGVPLIYPYAILPLGMALTSLQYGVIIQGLLKKERPAEGTD